jgi:hypothetical protein
MVYSNPVARLYCRQQTDARVHPILRMQSVDLVAASKMSMQLHLQRN